PLNWRFVVTWLMYIPLFFIFYISNSIRVNCGMTFENWKEWKVMLVGGLANSIGLVFILIVNYVVFFKTGSVYYGYFGELKHEVWLYVNIVFGLIPMMFLLPIFNRIFHKQTNRVWLGAMTTCMIFIMMTLSGSVTYLPF
ncbi:MAG: alpha/beta hydrolase, partial [Clostridia bacterium]